MKADVEKIIKELATSFLNAYRGAMYSARGVNQKVNKNTLIDSRLDKQTVIKHFDNGGDAIVELMLNDYITYIESGRRKGAKMPPVEPIIQWCRRKGIPTDNSTVFLIRRAISRDGIKPRPFMDSVMDDMNEQMQQIFFDRIFNAIIKDLTIFFNNI